MADNNRQPCRTAQCFSEPYQSCGCVGYGYVPVQCMKDVYAPDNALMQGTIFPELDLSICEYGKVCKQWGGADCDD